MKLWLVLYLSYIELAYSWLPKIVWTFWHAPLQSEDTHQIFQAYHQHHASKLEGWELRHMGSQSLWQWGDQIPGFRQIYNEQCWRGQLIQKRTDLMRIYFLKHFGGVYMDLTTLIPNGLDWLVDLQNLAQVQNNNGSQPDFLMIYKSDNHYIWTVQDKQSHHQFDLIPTPELFFMAAKPNNKFLQQWSNFLVQTKRQHYRKYGNNPSKSLIQQIAIQENIRMSNSFMKHPYFQNSIAATIVLQRKQKQMDTVKNGQSAVQYYNIWLMSSSVSGYVYLNPIQERFDNIFRADVEELKTKDIQFKYFVKLTKIQNGQLMRILDLSNKQVLQFQDTIYQNSVVYKNLLKGRSTNFQNLRLITNRFRNKICESTTLQTIKQKNTINQLSDKLRQLQQQQQKHQLQIKLTVQKNNQLSDRIRSIQGQNDYLKRQRSEILQIMDKLRVDIEHNKQQLGQQNRYLRFLVKTLMGVIFILIMILIGCIFKQRNKIQHQGFSLANQNGDQVSQNQQINKNDIKI